MGRIVHLIGAAALMVAVQGIAQTVNSPAIQLVNSDASLNVPAFVLPFSSYASPEAKVEQANKFDRLAKLASLPPAGDTANPIDIRRQRTDQVLFAPWLEAQRKRYAVSVSEQKIGTVGVQVFTPGTGIRPENKQRVLINLHGGAFLLGWGLVSQIESIPISAVAGIKVVSVNYRMFPEAKFPAASEDVATVYRELLRTYRPSQIGIYGCSAGGVLTSEAIAWFDKEKLPAPSAIVILSASLDPRFTGDSAYVTPQFGSYIAAPKGDRINAPYFEGVRLDDPLVAPSASAALLQKFPPTLLITGTRAGDMSAMTHSHLQLMNAAVEARLALWDGLDHCFMYNPDLPESQQVYATVAKFFAEMMHHAEQAQK